MEPPALPVIEDEVSVKASVAAYASPEVKALYRDWRQAVVNIQHADLEIGLRLQAQEQHANYQPKPRENADWLDHLTPWGELEGKLRPAEAKARSALADRIAIELA